MTTADSRREEIADYVIAHGQVRIDKLVEHFGVSRMTIHRHIDQLAAKGVLRKLHGAVTAQPSGIYESLHRYRATVATTEKQALAKAALAHIEPGQVIFLDDSTTAGAIAPFLNEIDPLTVISNSVAVANALVDADVVDFICLGGQYHRTYNAYIDHICLRAIEALRADLLICSASAIEGTTAFIQDQQVARVKQTMVASASKSILLADHTKFGKVALNVFGDLTAFDTVIVTDSLDPAEAERLRKAGVNLQIVKGASK